MNLYDIHIYILIYIYFNRIYRVSSIRIGSVTNEKDNNLF